MAEAVERKPKDAMELILSDPEHLSSLRLVAQSDPAAYELALVNLQKGGMKVKEIESVRRLVRDSMKSGLPALVSLSQVVITEKQLPSVLSALPDAPVSGQIVIPPRWSLSHEQGLRMAVLGSNKNDYEVVLPVPVLLVERNIILETQVETVKVAWFRDGRWKMVGVDRKVVASAYHIIELANFGCPVTTNASTALVQYFAAFEAANMNTIPRRSVTKHLGWQETGHFLLGRTTFLPDGRNFTDLAGGTTGLCSPENDYVTFQHDDEGAGQLADGFHEAGSYHDWVAAINELFTFPKVIAAVYLALTPPFLKILKAENFTVDWSCSTSTGKTTTLRIAGSCWGNPDEKMPSTVVHTWGSSSVWIERAATILNDIPLILDDTKMSAAGGKRDQAATKVSGVIYEISSGSGRRRGTITGIRSTGHWRTILLSSGEQPAVDFTAGDGGSARVITLWGLPFGKADGDTSVLVKRVNMDLKENYGHAAPRVLKFIFENRNQWPFWRDGFKELKAHFAAKAGGDPVGGRIADYFATLAIVIPLVHAALPELRRDVPIKTVMDDLWNTATKSVPEADRALVALQYAYDWAVSNQEKFYGRHRTMGENSGIVEPFSGWAGVWQSGEWRYVAYTTPVIKRLLQEWSFDVEAILRTWKDRGWLETDSQGRGKQVKILGEQVYCYCLKRQALIAELHIES